jgi:hypothetical protein
MANSILVSSPAMTRAKISIVTMKHAIIGQNRRSGRKKSSARMVYQRLVTTAGMISDASASLGSSVDAMMATAKIGMPTAVTPLAKPPNRKATATMARTVRS